ncbi:hypothetical protein NBRC116593_28820 [Sulfitobacter pacificus]
MVRSLIQYPLEIRPMFSQAVAHITGFVLHIADCIGGQFGGQSEKQAIRPSGAQCEARTPI